MKNIISAKECKELYENYSNNNEKILEKARGKKDSRNYWISLQELEDYIKHLKEKLGDKNTENMGVRIYLGAYGEDAKLDGFDVSKYQTIFLYPSGANEDPVVKGQLADDLALNKSRLAPPLVPGQDI